MQKIIVSVINDLTTDQRVDKICSSLQTMGFDVLLVGRKYKNSLELERTYRFHRMRVFFEKGMFSYVEFNIRLFFFLLFKKKSILLANDLDSLLPNYLISKIQKKKLVYDSHELFLELPELINRPKKRFIWQKIESYILPKLKNTYTVCQSIADYYNDKYQTNFKVVRNVSVLVEISKNNIETPNSKPQTSNSKTQNPRLKTETKEIATLPLTMTSETKSKKSVSSLWEDGRWATPKTIIYQGAINVGRGLELMIDTMRYLDNCQFIIVGDGEITTKIKSLIQQKRLSNKVVLLGKKTPSELKKITPQADLGISIEEDLGLNYHFALPNKIFDYIHAEIPVLVSNLPEMKQVVLDYQIGEIIQDRNPELLAKQIQSVLDKRSDFWTENLKKARLGLHWKNEEKVLKSIFRNLI